MIIPDERVQELKEIIEKDYGKKITDALPSSGYFKYFS